MSEPTPPTPPGSPEPPAPPAPPVPPVPQYGEYAPGYVPQAPAPQYAAYAPAPDQQPPGQYTQPYGAASYPQQPGSRRRKTWDLVLTIVLFVMGFFGMALGLLYSSMLPLILDQAYQQNGITAGFSGDTGAAGPIIAISHVILYLAALGIGLPLLITKRVAFWAPLAAGVIATAIFWGAIITVFVNDPVFIANSTR